VISPRPNAAAKNGIDDRNRFAERASRPTD